MKPVSTNRNTSAFLPIFFLFLLGLMLLGAGCSYTVDDMHQVRKLNVDHELALIRNSSATPPSPLTLQDAVEYALKHNLETRMAEMESAVQREAATGEKLGMLPKLLVNTEYSSKDKDVASTSVNPDTGVETLSPSISTERNLYKTNIDLAWNLIDFGVSYFRSRQAVNRLVIMEQRLRRARQKLMLDVTVAYGQTLAAREAARMATELLARFDRRREQVVRQVAANLVPKADGLKSEIRCAETLVRLAEFEGKFKETKAALAKLMGVGPGSEFTLAEMDFTAPLPEFSVDVRTMEEESLTNRPELFEKDMEERISADEAWISIINMLPRPELFLRFDYDSNKYLSTSTWYTLGVRAAWNVLELPRHMSAKRRAELQGEFVRTERLALSVGVLTQLHIALVKYHNALIQYRLRGQLNAKRSDLVEELELQRLAGEGDVEDMFLEMSKYFFTRNAYIQSYMDVLAAEEMIRATLGRDPEDRSALPLQYASESKPVLGATPSLTSPSTMLAVDRVHEILTDEELAGTPAPDAGYDGLHDFPENGGRTHRPVPAGPEPDTPGTSSRGIPSTHTQSSSGSGPALPKSSSADAIPQPKSGIASSTIARPAMSPGDEPWISAPPEQPGTRKGIGVQITNTPALRAVTVTAAGKIPAYDFFNLDSPPRLVVDVAGKWAYSGPSELTADAGGVGKIRVGEHEDKLRLVFQLTSPGGMEPAFEERDNALVIDF